MATYAQTVQEELAADLTRLVGDNSVFFLPREKGDAINEALMVWQLLVGEFDGESWSLPVVPDAIYYSTPRQLLTVTRVLYNGVPLTLASLPEMDYGSPGWDNALTSSPTYWMPNGLGEIAITPAAADGVLTIEGLSEAPRLISTGEWLQLTDAEIVPILLYAHHYLTFKEAGAELNATLDNVKALIVAAVGRNDELLTTELYGHYLGLPREESERPARAGGPQHYGVR